MSEVPGVKALRLLAQQPVAMYPRGGADAALPKKYFIELELNDGSIHCMPIEKTSYTDLVAGLAKQGVGIEQRVVARGSVASEKKRDKVVEQALPLNATTDAILSALGQVAYQPAASRVVGELDEDSQDNAAWAGDEEELHR